MKLYLFLGFRYSFHTIIFQYLREYCDGYPELPNHLATKTGFTFIFNAFKLI